jgi:hypothetical protein
VTDPRTPGRGHVLFAHLDVAEVISFSTLLPVATRVVLDASPFVHPLLEVLEIGRPCGVVLVSGERADLYDWRLGAMRRVTRVIVPSSQPRQRTVPWWPAARAGRKRRRCASSANAVTGSTGCVWLRPSLPRSTA